MLICFQKIESQTRMSNVQQQRMVVEQLRREASIKRISVSQAVEDIKVRPCNPDPDSYQKLLKT